MAKDGKDHGDRTPLCLFHTRCKVDGESIVVSMLWGSLHSTPLVCKFKSKIPWDYFPAKSFNSQREAVTCMGPVGYFGGNRYLERMGDRPRLDFCLLKTRLYVSLYRALVATDSLSLLSDHAACMWKVIS